MIINYWSKRVCVVNNKETSCDVCGSRVMWYTWKIFILCWKTFLSVNGQRGGRGRDGWRWRSRNCTMCIKHFNITRNKTFSSSVKCADILIRTVWWCLVWQTPSIGMIWQRIKYQIEPSTERWAKVWTVPNSHDFTMFESKLIWLKAINIVEWKQEGVVTLRRRAAHRRCVEMRKGLKFT